MSPTLYTTTAAASLRFSARERGCYSDREVMLKHLPYGMYRSGLIYLVNAEWGLSQNISSITSTVELIYTCTKTKEYDFKSFHFETSYQLELS